ncbi:kinase-like protein [Teratosphaeria nubilosa]|uniref:Kinase-like protein n=1 Tax=Teratosphaeria nubilosa TaxID=161662 RepID=A0A6G1L786_9PEZI|nr:kinase-like protein [Teratosphaeria nubilosa]
MPNQYGLEWAKTLWGLEPRWTAEPSLVQIEQISRQHLSLDEGAPCAVQFYAQGGFNKLFTIDTHTGRWLMRVALPVDPHRKSASEVCTMCFVRERTNAPVPAVLGHDASNNNDLKFEWILMEHMPGSVLERAWRTLSLTQKEDLVRKLVQFQSELFRAANRLEAIGNLVQAGPGSYKIGSIVSMIFFWGDRGAREIDRGPFQNSYQWLSARLNLALEDQDNILANTDDEDEIDDAQASKTLAKRLTALLPDIFRSDELESTMLFHDDLHEKNILVDQSGNITAVLDWECVSFFPLWMACQPPALLNGAVRLKEPQREDYGSYDPEVDEGGAEYNEGLSPSYWADLLAYERGHLRALFLSEMERTEPAWFAEYRDGEVKRDFELAILHCGSELTMKKVETWLDAHEKGERHSLRESLDA